MKLLLGIDLGTSYFKVGLFDRVGALQGLGRVRVEKAMPAPGRQELAVGDFWALLRRGLADALSEAGASASDVAALSYSSQANTFVLLDRDQLPLTPLVFWTDVRATPVDAVIATGGATRSATWLQLMADGLGFPIVTPSCAERACLGAAIFAAVATKWFHDIVEAASAMVHPSRIFAPRAGSR